MPAIADKRLQVAEQEARRWEELCNETKEVLKYTLDQNKRYVNRINELEYVLRMEPRHCANCGQAPFYGDSAPEIFTETR